MSEIASASAEQATGLDQVNTALTQMDEVTQQNSALVEQNAAAAKSLEQQSQAMDQQVSTFRLDDGAPAAAAAPSAVARKRSDANGSRQPAATAAKQRGVVGRMQAALATAFHNDRVSTP